MIKTECYGGGTRWHCTNCDTGYNGYISTISWTNGPTPAACKRCTKIEPDDGKIEIIVRSGTGTVREDGTFTDELIRVKRKPQEHHDWAHVNYLSRRYDLKGGTRTKYFICLNNPIKTRKERHAATD